MLLPLYDVMNKDDSDCACIHGNMMIKNSCYTSEPSHTDANEGLQDVLGHDVRVARLPNVFTIHIPWFPKLDRSDQECHLITRPDISTPKKEVLG